MTPAAQDAHGLEDSVLTKSIKNTIHRVKSCKIKNKIKHNHIIKGKNTYITKENEELVHDKIKLINKL